MYGTWLVGGDTAHLPSVTQVNAMKCGVDFHTMVDGKTCTTTALASHQCIGFVDGEQECDVSTAALNGRGCHQTERGGQG